MNKLRAYQLQDQGMDTVEANVSLGFAVDAREYDFPAKILKKLGVTKIRLLSNNPDKVRQLESAGVRVAERVPCQPRASKISRAYLQTKFADSDVASFPAGDLMTPVIQQSVRFRTTPQALFDMYLDSRRHGRFTGAPGSD